MVQDKRIYPLCIRHDIPLIGITISWTRFFFALKGNLSALCTRFRFHTNNTERLNGSWRTDLSTLCAPLDPFHWYDHFMDAVFSYLRL